ncbi:MAG TPA: bifunctional phosphoribosylaminoimidazolecarboxamide formyltransferase/IMP cyclohydrolase [Vicinamibacteria bacterium]|jgi:phosphoribosylaminoimidazolecarboxamide formyltransferase/IMP cyclohydrolase
MSGKRALISVADKTGVADFARELVSRGFEVVSSGGTAKELGAAGVPVLRVSEATGAPEILGGRVKTLHPRIHGGILARRNLPSDLRELEAQQITPVDLVVVNFYPFERTVAKGSPIPEIVENIDIGGPTMLRAAAKNFEHVLAVTDPSDYALVVKKLDEGVDLSTRLYLAQKAFQASARYEQAIAAFLGRLAAEAGSLVERGAAFPESLTLGFEKLQDLRYGENPHQSAAFYRDSRPSETIGIAGATQLHGKELSYNNILDLDAAWRLVRELPPARAAAAVIKHTNPCGAATADSLREAYVRARSTDPVSAFGGIVALNRVVDLGTAEELSSTFLEAVVAPGFEPAAVETLVQKKNLRLMRVDDSEPPPWSGFNLCRVLGGLLVQDWDREDDPSLELATVTERTPTNDEIEALRFAWTVSKHVKSNAIVLARGETLLGVGAGQMSRVDSCRIAIEKAGGTVSGAVAASDAFFPFRDGIDVLAEAGVEAIIQPGGSVRDEEVIAACNERGLAMVVTGRRHFRH